MTLEDIAALDCEILTCDQIKGVLGADPSLIRMQAREKPELLGFPVICFESVVKVPKRPFLKFMGWEDSNGKVSER